MQIKSDFYASNDVPGLFEAGDVPLVHAQETSDPFRDASTYRAFLVSGDKPRVDRVREVYRLVDGRDLRHRVDAFDMCRVIAWFVRHKQSGRVKVASSKCGLRWCPLCQRTKRFVMSRSIVPFLVNNRKPKFITLTLKHSVDPLADQIKRLYDCFRLLRRSKVWKSHIKGGIWLFQVKKSETDHSWHPHLHVACVGRYCPQADLSDAWLKITGDSTVVDIRAIKNPKKVADYVSRYATAPGDLLSLNDADAVELFDSLHGRRICGTFGVGRQIQLSPKKCPDADEWENIGSFVSVVSQRHREPPAAAIWLAWTTKQTTDCSMFYDTKPPPMLAGELMYDPDSFKQAVFDC